MKREIRGAKKGQIRDMGIRDMGIRDKEGTEMGQRTVKGAPRREKKEQWRDM